MIFCYNLIKAIFTFYKSKKVKGGSFVSKRTIRDGGNMLKKIIIMFLVVFGSFNIVFAEDKEPNKVQETNPVVSIGATDLEYQAITDMADYFNKEELAELRKNMNNISKQSVNNGIRFDFMLFTVSDSASLNETADNILQDYSFQQGVAPIFLVYNVKNKDYLFVIDSRLERFVFKDYLQTIMDDLGRNFSAKRLGTEIERLYIVLEMAIKSNALADTIQDNKVTVDEKHFRTHDFNESKFENKSKKVDNTNKSVTQEDNMGYVMGGILLFLTILAIMVGMRFRKKKQRR